MKRKSLVIAAGALTLTLAGAACGSTADTVAKPATSVLPGTATRDAGPGSAASGLRATLTDLLVEHEYLAGITISTAVSTGLDSDATKGASEALDKNSVALSEAIDSVYDGAGKSFLPLWRKHIGFFVDYTVGKVSKDEAKQKTAREGLDGYRSDFGAFLASANPNLTKEAVADALVPHVNSTFDAIDALVAGSPDAFAKLREGAAVMPGIAEVLAGAIAKQFPDKIAGDPGSAGSGLRSALTTLLVEHEYLAGITISTAVANGLDAAPTKAASAALDANSVALSDAIDSVYEGAGKSFLPLWRKHIGFFVDYTVGKLSNDEAKQKTAREGLDGYRNDFGAFLASANPNLTKDAVADALVPHVNTTFDAIDAMTAKSPTAFVKLQEGAQVMPGIAEVLAGAIAAQFPDKFAK
ncbi:MAG TPA: hypothetical protein VM841_12700 [Actinomycetota bacterium]|nr:hypothetical protein [Actinomycetota bacterium]